MKNIIKTGLIIACASIIVACSKSDEQSTTDTAMNPFFKEFDTPFGVPPFELIKIDHYKPAFEEGFKQHKAEIETIIAHSEKATFENTIVALDRAGQLLNRVSNVFFNITSANTNDTLDKIETEIAPLFSKHNDDIYMNSKLFERVNAVWEQKDQLGLNEEQNKLLEKNYKAFVRNGAKLNNADKTKLSEINQEISVLTLKFGQNTLAEVNEYKLVVEDKNQLKGLPEELIYAAAEDAKAAGIEGKWVFTLQNPSVMPFLQYAENRELREKIWTALKNKGNNNDKNDNKEIINKLANLRMQKAALLGYQTYAHYVHEEQMSKKPENVYKLLNDLWTPALEVAKAEAKELQEMMNKEGIKGKLQAYDWRYYAEKVRKQKYDLDEQELKPYFSLNAVRDGIFTVCKNLYGITFKELTNLPKYHEEVSIYQVLEKDGSHIGVLYMDFHPRPSKRGGAWMTSYSDQKMVNGKRVAPVISIVCNFSKPTAEAPALLTFDEVETYFHEFGHALHGLLSNVNYNQLAGTNVPTDFVELPSQIMENWAAEPAVLKMFAKHYKTGEVIPDALIEKMQKSGKYGQGFATTEYLAASLLDLEYHTIKEELTINANEFEKSSMSKLGLMDEIIPRYRSTYFNHIFAGGYSAGYYSYIWSGVLDTDAFEAFKETALFDPKTAEAFRKNVLEKGGSADPMELYKRFRGKEPSIEPLLRKRGLIRMQVLN
jgi:peptidyl-dipeptidase Dcp